VLRPGQAGDQTALGYFAVQTRRQELADTLAAAPPRPWWQRINETFRPHMHHMAVHHPRGSTVATAVIPHMLCMEDELIPHMFAPRPSDRPADLAAIVTSWNWLPAVIHAGLVDWDHLPDAIRAAIEAMLAAAVK
jgi:hypothetical protein